MADFCKQCSLDMFDEDFRELADISAPGQLYGCICEGCGFTIVDHDGVCLGACLLHHGDLPVSTMEDFIARSTKKE